MRRLLLGVALFAVVLPARAALTNVFDPLVPGVVIAAANPAVNTTLPAGGSVAMIVNTGNSLVNVAFGSLANYQSIPIPPGVPVFVHYTATTISVYGNASNHVTVIVGT